MPERLFAIGDIHGCSTALRALIEAIDPKPDDTIVSLGDIIDSKRFAGREKDHDALPELEALRAASTEGDEP